ncbi:MAG: hypothetical protein HPY64_04010 [Anaerolineae bacterium]|nr:hypothetical protein [Anaerolineae bacterium]
MSDQRTFWTAIVTMVIWVAMTVISIIFMTLEDVTALGAAAFVIIMAGVAIGGTIAIWTGETESARQPGGMRGDTRKTKRGDPERIARLIEQLDGDQMVELETLLMARRDDALDDR